MKQFLKFCLAGILLLTQIQFAFAQERTVTGKVSEPSGVLLPGVNIVVKGTTIGTISNEEGFYTITVPDENAIIVFSFVGYFDQETPVGDQTTIDATMRADVVGLDELVVVGYGTRKKANLTGAVATVNREELEKIKSINTTSMLEGQLPGIITKQTSGQPGEDNTSFSIRGFGSPLILIDGNEGSLSSLDPSMIESISVLKDASAAIYGARSGNGVILVTTKRGRINKAPTITYEGSYSIQQFTHKPSLITDAGRYIELMREAETNVGLTPTWTEEEMQKWYDGGPGYESTDWWDYLFVNWAPRIKHNLSAEGGSEKVSYYLGLGISDQQSVIASEDFFYKRYNLLSNIDAKITDRISFSMDLSYSHEHSSETELSQTVGWAYKAQPMATATFPGAYPDGPFVPASNTYGTHQRIVGAMYKDVQGGYDRIPTKFNSRFELSYDLPVDGLSARTSLDYRIVDRRNKRIERQWDVWKQDPETLDIIYDGTFGGAGLGNYVQIWDYNFTQIRPKAELRYNKIFGGDHSLEALILGEYIEDDVNQIMAKTENLLSNDLLYLGLGDKTYHEMDQTVTETSRASFAGRINYGYQGKYLAEATFRYDASSFFPPDTRWGFFPSFSAGWRLSDEAFLSNQSWLDNLKLRASYSKTGYDLNAIRYDYFSGFNVFTEPLYLLGTNALRRIQQGTLANPNMTWEKMTNYNIGLDGNMLQGLIGVVAEVFYRERTDILATPQEAFPSTFGAQLSQQNLNSMTDRGFEIELSHQNQVGDIRYSVRGIFTYARSKWVHFEEEDYTDPDEIRILQQSGNWTNRSIGYVSDGLFRSQAEIDESPVDQDQAGNATLIPGDIKYKDLNDDGVITWADQKYLGYGTGEPDLSFGLNLNAGYKGLNLSVTLQGASMYSGNITGTIREPFLNQSSPIELHWQERFHETENPDGVLPANTYGERAHNNKFSDFWLTSLTYLRVENLNLSYSLPKNWISKVGMKNLNVFVSGQNLYVLSNLGIWSTELDPEATMNPNSYPPHRTITFGLTATF